MMLLLALLCSSWGEPARCLELDKDLTFDQDILQVAVDTNSVYVATKEKLYQLSHDLSLVHSLTQRGIWRDKNEPSIKDFSRVSEKTEWDAALSVNVLLPFVKNHTLISCGGTHRLCGYCEILDLKNISNLLHREDIQVGPLESSSKSVSFLVDVKKDPTRIDTYILTAIQKDKTGQTMCSSDSQTINLHDTDNRTMGGIFSVTDPSGDTPIINSVSDVEFVDGFQINSTVYLFSNVASGSKNKVRLLWFEAETSKIETLKSLRVATLSISDGHGGSRLLASSLISGGEQVFWSGVFSVDGGPTQTELVLFDIQPDLSETPKPDPDFFYRGSTKTSQLKALKPKAVLFKQNSMSSVLAVKQKGWTVFFIGTTDGQLIKLSVDRNFHPTCPQVLYWASGDQKVFPKILLDPVDHKHVYVPFQKQIKRVPVSKCSTYTEVRECLSAQDPFCVWCVSRNSCTFGDDCKESQWLSIPDESQQKLVSHRLVKDVREVKLIIQTHLTVEQSLKSDFTCQISGQLCSPSSPPPRYPQCTCTLSAALPADGRDVSIEIKLGATTLSEKLKLTNCSNIHGEPSSFLCQQCIRSGCGWRDDRCSWASQEGQNDSVCLTMKSEMNVSRPVISSITPSVVSFYGKNHALLSGHNLHDVIRVRIHLDLDCNPKESPVWNNNGQNLTFHIPSTDTKGVVKVCVVLADGSCHGNANITYQSSPSCTNILPSSCWMSGERNITVFGSYLNVVEGVTHSHAPQQVIVPWNTSPQSLTYESPAAENTGISMVFLKVANQTLPCSTNVTYYADPKFTSFTAMRARNDIRIVIQKEADNLKVSTAELLVWGIQDKKLHPCIMDEKERSNDTDSITCVIRDHNNPNFNQLNIKFGKEVIELKTEKPWIYLMLFAFLLIPVIIAVVVVYRRKQKKFAAKMNIIMENLERDIRNDIRQGFVDLQTVKVDLMENVGAIPFLDYKHFASRIFFPESESLIALSIKDIGQDVVTVQLDESCESLSKLLQDQVFLTSMVHALEEQKSFTIKDKCSLASLLTVALHGNLSYLTEVMKVLLKDLMEANSTTQPKLLLRRTESIVEKLLTNWMSICLYGFLRESVGQHLFVLVSALTQQISKGPVDCVTEKALYTLSEDWLLWQAQDFSSLKLEVQFAVGTEGEVSEPLEVEALSCDTVEQLKEKILSTFKAKFGFPYSTSLRDMCVEYEKGGSYFPLQEVDATSEVIGEVMKLNTLKHYQVKDGATVKVLSKKNHPPLSPQGSVKDEENFSGKYFHLIDPDVEEDQGKNPERKKLKLKEVHLTKLLSTKVAVHSYVENLFRSIWGTSQSRAPHAVKYFFDFLDSQADNMKISDPDVRHIWKTNSLPLRFWVNILKNPQFVFDTQKTPHLDGCLSVIAQAFMDSFSLSETQLGKHAPTNKLLYAKDIPKFKQEVKAYYKQIRDQPPLSDAEFKDFLQGESKKHENEFNEAAALRELYKYIQRYFTEIKERLSSNGAPVEVTEQLQHVKDLFDGLKSCSWN